MNKQQNQVRPRMSRENYEWLKSVVGKANDEKIANLKKLDEHYERDNIIINNLNQCLDITGQEKIRMKSERDTFIGLLCVSMVINFGLLGYVATLQGWF